MGGKQRTKSALVVACLVLSAAACSSDPPSSGSPDTTSEADARLERRAERREERERAERREERLEDQRQAELEALPADLPLDDAVLRFEELPAEFQAGQPSTGEAFEEALADAPPPRIPPVCPGARASTTNYGSLPPEDVAGIVFSPAPGVLFIHLVARFEQAPALWNNFATVADRCTRSFVGEQEGVVGVALDRLGSLRAGRAIAVGYRQVVTLADAAPTLFTRFVAWNGRCVSELTVAARPVEPGQYTLPEALLVTTTERLNRVAGCSD